MSYIYLFTGGNRSGKSVAAEALALRLSNEPIYLATARILDNEMRKRVEIHQQRRQSAWINKEEEKYLSKVNCHQKVVLIDCVTLWATNWFFDLNEDINAAFEAMKNEIDTLCLQDTTLIFVTNEIGLGGIPINRTARLFADLQGLINQYIANRANEVTMMISGLPLKLK